MAKVLKRADLSKKDYRVETGILRVKDAVYNITSNIGDGSKADFNEINPLLYWPAPSNPKTNAVAHVLFNDGLGYYTFNGTVWALNFFYPSSAYVSPGPKVYKALLTQTGASAPVATVLENTLGGTVVWTRTGVGTYEGTLTGAFTIGKTFSIGYIGDSLSGAISLYISDNIFVNRISISSMDITANVVELDTEEMPSKILIEVYP